MEIAMAAAETTFPFVPANSRLPPVAVRAAPSLGNAFPNKEDLLAGFCAFYALKSPAPLIVPATL
jgi:hypothetical protein